MLLRRGLDLPQVERKHIVPQTFDLLGVFHQIHLLDIQIADAIGTLLVYAALDGRAAGGRDVRDHQVFTVPEGVQGDRAWLIVGNGLLPGLQGPGIAGAEQLELIPLLPVGVVADVLLPGDILLIAQRLLVDVVPHKFSSLTDKLPKNYTINRRRMQYFLRRGMVE